jgi:peptidoglycan/LPS O-acetylase OafA/YrhL
MHQRAKDHTTAAVQLYFPAFDYIRAIAALGVFASHANTSILPINSGNACVQVFFALSGFLIGGILLKTKPKDLPRFYYNRSIRIWIPYFIAIALLAAVTALKQGFHDPKFSEFLAYMATFTYNWFGPPQLEASHTHMPLDGTGNHFWSICVEEQFYLIAPLMLTMTGRFPAVAILISLIALNFFAPHHFASISVGVLLAVSGTRRAQITLVFFVAFTMTVVLFSYAVWIPFLAGTIIGTSSLIQGNSTTISRALGGASFPFYLNHWIGLFAANAITKYLGQGVWLSGGAGLSLALTLSLVHYLCIDRTLNRYRDRWYSRTVGVAISITGGLLVATGLILGLAIR